MSNLHYSFKGLTSNHMLDITRNYSGDKEFVKLKFKNSFSYTKLNQNCFSPKLKPKKSSIIPAFLKLSKQNKNEICESNDNNSVKEASVDQKDSSYDSSASSELDERQNEDEKCSNNFEKDENYQVARKINFMENIYEEEDKVTESQRHSISYFRRKMNRIKSKCLSIQSRESNEVIHDEFKKKYDIDNKYNDINKDCYILMSQKKLWSEFMSLSPKKPGKKPMLIRDALLNLSKRNNNL